MKEILKQILSLTLDIACEIAYLLLFVFIIYNYWANKEQPTNFQVMILLILLIQNRTKK